MPAAPCRSWCQPPPPPATLSCWCSVTVASALAEGGRRRLPRLPLAARPAVVPAGAAPAAGAGGSSAGGAKRPPRAGRCWEAWRCRACTWRMKRSSSAVIPSPSVPEGPSSSSCRRRAAGAGAAAATGAAPAPAAAAASGSAAGGSGAPTTAAAGTRAPPLLLRGRCTLRAAAASAAPVAASTPGRPSRAPAPAAAAAAGPLPAGCSPISMSPARCPAGAGTSISCRRRVVWLGAVRRPGWGESRHVRQLLQTGLCLSPPPPARALPPSHPASTSQPASQPASLTSELVESRRPAARRPPHPRACGRWSSRNGHSSTTSPSMRPALPPPSQPPQSEPDSDPREEEDEVSLSSRSAGQGDEGSRAMGGRRRRLGAAAGTHPHPTVGLAS